MNVAEIKELPSESQAFELDPSCKYIVSAESCDYREAQAIKAAFKEYGINVLVANWSMKLFALQSGEQCERCGFLLAHGWYFCGHCGVDLRKGELT